MGEEMKDRRAEGARCRRRETCSQLAYRRVGQDLLDIVLGQRDGSGEKAVAAPMTAITAKVSGAKTKRKCSRAVI